MPPPSTSRTRTNSRKPQTSSSLPSSPSTQRRRKRRRRSFQAPPSLQHQPENETLSDAPRQIPGFYYDETRRRYFRIQENHSVPIATSVKGAGKYTVQAVQEGERCAAERRERAEFQDGRKRRCVTRDQWIGDPVSGLDLSVRLSGRGAGEGVRRQFASLLRRNTLMRLGDPGPKFAVESRIEGAGGTGTGSRALFTTASVDGRWERGREMCVTPLLFEDNGVGEADVCGLQTGDCERDQLRMRSEEDGGDNDRRPIYDPSTTIPILHADKVTSMLPLSDSLIMWSSLRPGANEYGGARDASQLCLSKRYDSEYVPWRSWRDEFGDWATAVNQFQTLVWDIDAPKSWSGGPVVMATSNGIRICEIDGGGMTFVSTPTTFRDAEAGVPSEFMVVSFKDEKVYMTGDRTGDVALGDLRGSSTVKRLRSPSGVTALKRLRNENLILVGGLETMSVYDLRFNKVSGRHGKQSHLAQAVLDFDVPPSMQQKRYGMGFDYDEDLNIVASASTNFGEMNKVGLWDVSTGQKIDDGLLVEKVFAHPVHGLQMVDLRGDGQGRKSILTASGGVIEEWYV